MRYRKITKNPNWTEAKKIFDISFTNEKNSQSFSHQWFFIYKYGKLYGIFDGDKLMGICACVYPVDFDNYISVIDLCVEPNERNKGYGQKILKYTLSQIKKSKFRYIDIMIDTDLKDFFEKNDFKILFDHGEKHDENYRYFMYYEK
jgi:GNAT superfamily N-acetyltransferase